MPDFASQLNTWENLWPDYLEYNFVIQAYMPNGFYLERVRLMVIHKPITNHPMFDLKVIHIDVITLKTVTLTNYYSVPIEYKLQTTLHHTTYVECVINR